ncbi:MAG: glutathione S-transferase family protein [Alphaproteobacteria bacterium]|nr:glutathione S-transferase family protein [Alphaproteobacteria bacterium]
MPDPIKLHIMPPCWGLPSASPFVLKLQTWLRVVDIPHETCVLSGPPRSPTGKVPYIEEADGTLICDTPVIMAHLTERFGVTLDEGLSEADQARATLLQRLFEDHLYWAMVTWRWRVDEGWAHSRVGYFGGLPPVVRDVAPWFIRRQVMQAQHGQGFGRMPLEQIWARVEQDLRALSVTLGDQEHFLGRLSTIDATAYGFLANLALEPHDSPLKDRIQAHDNLVAFVERMKARWWATP